MKVFVLDGDGVGLDFALRCQMAGHDVKLWMAPSKHPHVGEGIVTVVKGDWRRFMKWADLIYMTDDSKYYSALQPFFDEGYPIWGTNPKAAALETDRKFGMDVMKACGIELPEWHEFSTYEEGSAFVREHGGRWACKPFNDADKSKAYLCKDAADMCYMFDKWAKEGKPKCKFLLQEFIPGMEFAVSGFYTPQTGWLGGVWCESFEHKKFMNGDVGCNTGEMGTVAKWVKDSQLAGEMLEPLTSALATLNFCGHIDVNTIVDKNGQAWPLEFTARAGWPQSYLQYSMNQGDPCQFMKDALDGIDSLKVKSSVAVGVVLVLNPFPWTADVDPMLHEDTPLYGINEDNIEHIHLGSVKAGKAPHIFGENIKDKPCFVSAGPYLAIPVGLGHTVKAAQKKAYALLDELSIPDSPLYRTDIGDKLEKWIPELQKHGYATEWAFD